MFAGLLTHGARLVEVRAGLTHSLDAYFGIFSLRHFLFIISVSVTMQQFFLWNLYNTRLGTCVDAFAT